MLQQFAILFLFLLFLLIVLLSYYKYMFFFQIRQLPTFLQQVQDLRQGRFPMHVAEEPFFFKRRIFNDNFPVEFPFQLQHNGLQCFPGEHQFPRPPRTSRRSIHFTNRTQTRFERDCQHLIGLYPYIFILISIHFHLPFF